MAEVVVLADAKELAAAAADRVVRSVAAAIAERGTAHLALTGGSTAEGLYRALLEPARREAIAWSRVELWWGDERYVPAADAASNARLALASLVDVEAIRGARVHTFPVEAATAHGRGPHWAAAEYAGWLRARIPADRGGLPIFDVLLLGMGADGHVLSVFPGSPALAPDAPLVMAIPAPSHIRPHLQRLTLNPGVLGAARLVLVMCHGAAKAARVAEVLEGTLDVSRLPAQLARGPNAVWLLDSAAASALTRR